MIRSSWRAWSRPASSTSWSASINRALGGELAIYDRAGSGSPARPSRARAPPIEHDGEPLARLAATGPRGASRVELCAETLDLLVHHAHARELAAATHEEAMRLTFAELTEHNQRLQRAVARLEELDRLKSNFLATMSHELRTPLTSVIGYAEMMAEGLAGPITGEQREYLTTILGKADQLLGLITAVLDVASLESGQLALERATLSLAESSPARSPRSCRRPAGAASRSSSTRAPTAVVVGDRRKIRQVVSSLVSNAVKFTPERGKSASSCAAGRSRTPAEATTPPGDPAVVTDSGIGISRDQVAKIFEPFFQVDSSSTRAFGGTGLGPHAAKAYVEAHGGRIWVDTTPGQARRRPWPA